MSGKFFWVASLLSAALMSVGCATGDTTTATDAPAAEVAAEAETEPAKLTLEEAEQIARQAWANYQSSMSHEERLEKMGLEEDPGVDPDPERVFRRGGMPFRIEKFEKRHAIYRGQQPGWVRPLKGVGIPFEIYRDDEEYVWVFIAQKDAIDFEARGQAEKYPMRNLPEEDIRAFNELRDEFGIHSPGSSSRVVRFRESSAGLPTTGSFRNSPAIADMNGDGHLDIIIPPQRGGGVAALVPTIYLGDGGETWREWTGINWPLAMNYGDVEAADFNGDGHMDLAFAIHLTGAAVFLGDSQGNFVDASNGLPNQYPSRQVEAIDVDADGDLDLVLLTEGPMKTDETRQQGEGRMQVYLNDGKAGEWTAISVGKYWEVMGGDWLASGNFNGDAYPDFLASSIYFHGVDLFWMSNGPGEWYSFGRGFLPFFSYVADVAAIDNPGAGRDDAIITYGRIWPSELNPEEVTPPAFRAVSGIERVSFSPEGAERTPIVSWDSQKPTWALAASDFDGDGIADLLFRRTDPAGMHLLVGQPDGSFAWGTVEGMEYLDNTAYDMATADINRDGREDVVILYESSSRMATSRDGSIRVYLNETRN